MDVFTSAKSAQYVEIMRQGCKQTSRIPGVTSYIRALDVTLGCNNTVVLGKLAQSGEQWKSFSTTLMLPRLQ